MASMLKINRTTVVSAYEDLRIEGWLEVIERKETLLPNNSRRYIPDPLHPGSQRDWMQRRA